MESIEATSTATGTQPPETVEEMKPEGALSPIAKILNAVAVIAYVPENPVACRGDEWHQKINLHINGICCILLTNEEDIHRKEALWEFRKIIRKLT